ncbi:TIGR04104 family putative zinc finger protein [Aquisalibacillus elongatus]|uniref:CXXC-20-CXXC protein n=1 Tax=Aquisalibacillus elongatus TaxID=485577 RepID=A0A3N5CAS8_9BACI|nr:TIGR04104 family putative zinc finger protein [Aquisalibacillus elongatus]RPF53891.1 CXXC-20-CXXC protein [Aquisalibacillus elongatus]
MPKCQNCDQQWSYKQTVKKSFTLDTGMPCPYCERKQYPTAKTRKKASLLNFVPLLSLLLPVFWNDISGWVVLGLLLGSSIFLMSVYPVMLKLSNEEEGLW